MQKQISTVFCTDLERNGSLLWCLVLNICENKGKRKKDKAVLSFGLQKWLNKASLYQCLRGLQSLLGHHMRAQQQDNFTVMVLVFTWVKKRQWLLNGPLINCKCLAIDTSWKCFLFPFHVLLYGSYWGNGPMVESLASFKGWQATCLLSWFIAQG